MVVVSDPVLNVPVGPVPPPPEEAQFVLLVADQVISVLSLYAIKVEVAERIRVGIEPVVLPLDSHEARLKVTSSSTKINPGSLVKTATLLFDMLITLANNLKNSTNLK